MESHSDFRQQSLNGCFLRWDECLLVVAKIIVNYNLYAVQVRQFEGRLRQQLSVTLT